MRRGDFSALCTGPGGAFVSGICSNGNNQLYNPFTGSPFPNNQIPDSMITSQSKKLLTYLPLPTVADSPGPPQRAVQLRVHGGPAVAHRRMGFADRL